MGDVEIKGDGFEVDATLLSAAFGLSQREVRSSMRDGRIVSRCETGAGEDAGRWRLTFYFNGRALRLTVNAEGEILARSTFDAPRRQPGPEKG